MLLACEGLWCGYATGDVLQDVSVRLDEGEIVGVIGRNGVGKSTLMRTLIGLLRARRGTVRLRGDDLTRLPAEERARRGLGYVPQGRDVFPAMTVQDNLRTGAFIGGGRRKPDFDLVHGYFPVLRDRARQLAGTLSGGQQEMLSIARALVAGPEILLLDEPSDGVQPSIVQEIGEALLDLNRSRGLSVLIVEQNVDLMQRVAQRAYVLDKGMIVAALDRGEVEDERRMADYLAI